MLPALGYPSTVQINRIGRSGDFLKLMCDWKILTPLLPLTTTRAGISIVDKSQPYTENKAYGILRGARSSGLQGCVAIGMHYPPRTQLEDSEVFLKPYW